MMKKHILFYLFFLLYSPLAFAGVSPNKPLPPKPPAANPHPPTSKADINRVNFAESVIKNLIQTPLKNKSNEDLREWLKKKNIAFNLDRNCIEKKLCWSAKNDVFKYVNAIQNELGTLEEMKFTHVIPWSYDSYASFKGIKSTKDRVPTPASEQVRHMSLGETANTQKSEYMIHSYGKFKGKWYNINVIVTEDDKHNLLFRRFFIIEIPPVGEMIPGMVC